MLNGTRWEYETDMRYERVSAAASMTKDGWLVTGGAPERAVTLISYQITYNVYEFVN